MARTIAWSRARITERMQRWNEEYGQPPSSHEWDAAIDTPALGTVRKRFGSWEKAIKAAGLVSRRQMIETRVAPAPAPTGAQNGSAPSEKAAREMVDHLVSWWEGQESSAHEEVRRLKAATDLLNE